MYAINRTNLLFVVAWFFISMIYLLLNTCFMGRCNATAYWTVKDMHLVPLFVLKEEAGMARLQGVDTLSLEAVFCD